MAAALKEEVVREDRDWTTAFRVFLLLPGLLLRKMPAPTKRGRAGVRARRQGRAEQLLDSLEAAVKTETRHKPSARLQCMITTLDGWA